MMSNGGPRKFHVKTNRQKQPEVETVLSKKLSVIVDSSHRPVFHKNGHFLIFPSRSSAERWYKKNITDLGIESTWRIERMDFDITR